MGGEQRGRGSGAGDRGPGAGGRGPGGRGVGEGKRADRMGCGLKEWAVRGQGKERGRTKVRSWRGRTEGSGGREGKRR